MVCCFGFFLSIQNCSPQNPGGLKCGRKHLDEAELNQPWLVVNAYMGPPNSRVKINGWKMRPIFRGYVIIRECTSYKS